MVGYEMNGNCVAGDEVAKLGNWNPSVLSEEALDGASYVKVLEARETRVEWPDGLRAIAPDPSTLYDRKSRVRSDLIENHFENSHKPAKLLFRQNHIALAPFTILYDPEGAEEGFPGSDDGLMYEGPVIDYANYEQAATVFMTFLVKRVAWGLDEFAHQELSPRNDASTNGLQDAWFPGNLKTEGLIDLAPTILPVTVDRHNECMHGDILRPVFDWSQLERPCSVLISYVIEGVAYGSTW